MIEPNLMNSASKRSTSRPAKASHNTLIENDFSRGRELLLRTGLESFPSFGSSLFKAPLRGRFRYLQLLAVYLPMAVGMQHH
jgi:hypothetical protein